MPIPKPKDNEKEDVFISRCMSNDTMKTDYPKVKQRLAICFTSWRGKGKIEDEEVVAESDGIIKIPVDSKLAVDIDTKVIVISDRLGISALYSLNRKRIIEYYFDEYKKWTAGKAIEWYNSHKSIKAQPEEQAKKFFKVDEEKRIVYGVALVPWEIDLQGDIMTEEEVENAAHAFVENFQNIDEMHKVSGLGTLLESYLAPVDFEMNGVKITKGSWVLVTRAKKSVWEKIKNNELVGYSIGYSGEREEIDA